MCEFHDTPVAAPDRVDSVPSEAAARWSRRRLLGAVVLGTAGLAVGVGRRNAAPAEAGARLASSTGTLDLPANVYETAERLSLRPPPGKLIFPVDAQTNCYVLDNFGDARGSTRLHEGVDIMGSADASVFAVADGVLTKRYTNTGTAGWGWTLYDDTADIEYKYFHLREEAHGLEEGDRVELGQVIGNVGSSGTSGPTNIHLHFERRLGSGGGSVATNALPYLHVPNQCGVSPPIRA